MREKEEEEKEKEEEEEEKDNKNGEETGEKEEDNEETSHGMALNLRKKAEGKRIDSLDELPDDILHRILSFVPTTLMIRTCILGRRWRDSWKQAWPHSTIMDFGEIFAANQSNEQFKATVNQFLELHKAEEINTFCLKFNPRRKYMSEVEKWSAIAVRKGVKEVDIDLCQQIYDNDDIGPVDSNRLCNLPDSVFSCESVTDLNLSHCDFRPPPNFSGYGYLRNLQLYSVRITDPMLQKILSSCLRLEQLTLRKCCALINVRISAPHLPLKRLTAVECQCAEEIQISAPNLRSFHFAGDFIRISFRDIRSLVDVVLNGVNMECSIDKIWITVLRGLEHIKILTLCDLSLQVIEKLQTLPITFHVLQELQIRLDLFSENYLDIIYYFFNNCPCLCLEKLFIQLPSRSEYSSEIRLLPDTPGINHIKVIKINDFRGLKIEMELVRFFLKNVIGLRSMTLVVAAKQRFQTPLNRLGKQVLMLRPSLSCASIVMCNEDGPFAPTHTNLSHLENKSSTPPHAEYSDDEDEDVDDDDAEDDAGEDAAVDDDADEDEDAGDDDDADDDEEVGGDDDDGA